LSLSGENRGNLVRPRHTQIDRQLAALDEQFVAVAGPVTGSRREISRHAANIDHVYVTIQAGQFGPLRISLNTSSLKNGLVGFDPRVRLAMVKQSWVTLPAAGIRLASPFNYADISAHNGVDEIVYEKAVLEELLIAKATSASFVQAWGELHVRPDLGLHQVHSRQPSSAVRKAVIGRDGSICFYFQPDQPAELLLFKFDGQP
jgi:hypothetical protein